MQVLLIEQVSTASGTLGASRREGVCANALPNEPRITNHTSRAQLLNVPPLWGTKCLRDCFRDAGHFTHQLIVLTKLFE
jgi:hypothetical protein